MGDGPAGADGGDVEEVILFGLLVEGLGEGDSRELDGLLADAPGLGRDALASAASAATLALRLTLEAMPPSLFGRLVEQGRAAVREAAATKVVQMPARDQPERPAPAFGPRLGWYAAAASLLLAVAAWWPRLSTELPAPVPEVPTAPSFADQREALIASGSTSGNACRMCASLSGPAQSRNSIRRGSSCSDSPCRKRCFRRLESSATLRRLAPMRSAASRVLSPCRLVSWK